MEKIKNIFWKCIDFIYKHKVISFCVAFAIATSFILFHVFANDDQYANRLVVNNAKIVSIEDGTSFDSEEGDGKDVSATNGILKNFDKITYNATYTLDLKGGETTTDTITDRSILVDVIVPNTINALLSSPNEQGDGEHNPLTLNQDYNYYEFEIDNASVVSSSETSSFSFYLNRVNTQTPSTQFNPIILIKESTDENFKAISEMNESEMQNLISNLPTNKLSCDSNTIHCTTTMTGRYDFNISLYQGAYSDSSNTITNKKFPIGIGVTVDSDLIGIYIPNSITFELGSTFDNNNINVSYVDNSFVNYKDPSKDYIIRYDEVNELNNISNRVLFENGIVTIMDLKYNPSNNFIGTAAFELNSSRISEAITGDHNIVLSTSNLKIGDTVIRNTGNSLTVIDYYQKFVGSYLSKIVINPSENDGYNNAFVNFNQNFVLEEVVSYASDGIGDPLSQLDTYIKIDPQAFTISEEGNTISDSLAIMRYGHGLWTGDYFELTGASECPTDISSLSKENLMNLYGGPCLREKNTVLWNDSETDLPIIIVDAVFGDETSEELNVGSFSGTITLTGKVNNDINLMSTSHQISTSATGMFNNTLYYLSKNINTNDLASAKNKNNYVKAEYDFNNKTLLSDDTTLCSPAEYCNISGETVFITGYTTGVPSVHTYFNNIERSSFVDYPIEWRIDSNASSNDETVEFDAATISVYIPKSLNYLYAETMVNDIRKPKNYASAIDVGDPGLGIGEAMLYTYTFNEDEITDGTINALSIFTDIFLNTKSGSNVKIFVSAEYSGYKIDGTNLVRITDGRPLAYTSSFKETLLYNGSNVTTYGNATPRFIEKEKPYTYTMKSYNNSSSINEANSGYAYSNATMYYMLPYIEDSNYKTFGKKFTNASYKVKLTENPTGYTVYYTTDTSVNVINDIYTVTGSDTHTNWKSWNDPTKEVEATAIKVVKNTNWDIDTYFYSENGITVNVTPVKNAQADAYYNGFVVTVDRPEGYIPECEETEMDCDTETFSDKLYFQSSKSLVEVYSRQISGFVFEDYNYSDMYEHGEEQLENIVVELYKLKNTSYTEENSTNPNAFVDTSVDELISTTTTDAYGNYSFTGLDAGNYYVLFRYDGEKYTPCERFGGLLTGLSTANQVNSKAIGRNLVNNEAVSEILTLSSSESSNSRYINLGLRIRKEFGVEINKYITSVVQTSNEGTKTYEFDRATKVNIDIKNLKNTKFRVTYSFDIVNTKFFPGYIGVVADLMPAGMTFDNTLPENADWALYDGILYYTGIQNKLLLPGDKQYFNLVLDLDTSKGGTYLNIVAAQQPILMGDDVTEYDFSAITVDVEDNEQSVDNPTGTSDENSNNPDEGNGE